MKRSILGLLFFCTLIIAVGLFAGCAGKNPPPPISEAEYNETIAAADAAEAKAEGLEKERIALEKKIEEKKLKKEQMQRDIENMEEELYYLKKGSGR